MLVVGQCSLSCCASRIRELSGVPACPDSDGAITSPLELVLRTSNNSLVSLAEPDTNVGVKLLDATFTKRRLNFFIPSSSGGALGGAI